MPNQSDSRVLVLGSAPSAAACRDWPRAPFTHIVAINNAWRLRPDWDYLIHPEDFPRERRPEALGGGQQVVTATDFVPAQNAYGGFVYGGGTMAFTAGYWALFALRPAVLAFCGCDMIYPTAGRTHFYGTGAPDPLRPDVSLRSLEAKSARLSLLAARQGCRVVRMGNGESRLVCPPAGPGDIADPEPPELDPACMADPLSEEQRLNYLVASGRYWEARDSFDTAAIDRLDAMWLAAYGRSDIGGA